MLAELVDDHQVGAAINRARNVFDSSFQRARVKAAPSRPVSTVLRDPERRAIRQDHQIHVAMQTAFPLCIDLDRSAQAQTAQLELSRHLGEQRIGPPA